VDSLSSIRQFALKPSSALLPKSARCALPVIPSSGVLASNHLRPPSAKRSVGIRQTVSIFDVESQPISAGTCPNVPTVPRYHRRSRPPSHAAVPPPCRPARSRLACSRQRTTSALGGAQTQTQFIVFRINPASDERPATRGPRPNSAFPRINPMNPEKASRPTAPTDSTDKHPMHPGAALHHAGSAEPASVSRPVTGPRSAGTPAQSAQIAILRINPMNPEKASPLAAPSDSTDNNPMQLGTGLHHAGSAGLAPSAGRPRGRAAPKRPHRVRISKISESTP